MQFSVVAAATILVVAQGTYAAGFISGAARAGATAGRVAKAAKTGAEVGQDVQNAKQQHDQNKGKRESAQQWESELTNCLHEYHQTESFSMHSDGADKVTLVNVGPKCMSIAQAYSKDPQSKQLDPVFGQLHVLNANTLQLTNIPASYQQEVHDAIAAEKAAKGQQ